METIRFGLLSIQNIGTYRFIFCPPILLYFSRKIHKKCIVSNLCLPIKKLMLKRNILYAITRFLVPTYSNLVD